MPLSFSNKVPSLYNYNPNDFNVANSTPAYSEALKKKMEYQPLQIAPIPVQKATTAAPVAPAYVPPAPVYTPPASTAPAVPPTAQSSAAPAPVYVPPSAQTNTSSKTATAAQVPTFSGILFDLIQKATKGNENVKNAREDLSTFQQNTADKIAAIRSTPVALEFQQGRAQAVQQASAEKEKALQTGVANALEAQGQELGALNQAAGLTSPQQLQSGNIYIDPVTGKPIAGGPTQVPYTNQFIDPTTGQPVGGGATAGGLGGNMAQNIQSVAQQVLSGQISPDQAYKLFGNNLAFNNAINQEIARSNPAFDFTQAQALADAKAASTEQTGTIGGQLVKGAETVKQHMLTLENLYKDLAAQYRFPVANKSINFIAEQLGSGPLQSYNIALQNVRDELAKILGGGTSTEGSRATAKELLPDNMTPDQLTSSIQTATELMNSKISEYTRTPQFAAPGGQAPAPAGGTGSGGLYDW